MLVVLVVMVAVVVVVIPVPIRRCPVVVVLPCMVVLIPWYRRRRWLPSFVLEHPQSTLRAGAGWPSSSHGRHRRQ